MAKSSWQKNKTWAVARACFLGLIVCTGVYASQNAGLAGSYLHLSSGAAASGMGGAYTAAPQYLISWYNPSQLPLLRNTRASAGAGLRSMGRTEGWASFDFRVPPRVGMGLSLIYKGDPFLSGMYDGYYEQGSVVEEVALPTMNFSFLNLKIGAGYFVSKRLSLGGSIAIIHQSLPTTPNQSEGISNSTSTAIGAFCVAATYKVSNRLVASAVVRNLGLRSTWHIGSDEGYDQTFEEVTAPVVVLAGSYKTRFRGRDLIWNLDLVNYLFDENLAVMDHPVMVIATGVQWNGWDNLHLRAGIGDLEVTSEMYRNTQYYRDGFSPRLTAGFSYNLSEFKQGMLFNYALSTDRIWAGMDQQFDLMISF